jgi:hypothetical protein
MENYPNQPSQQDDTENQPITIEALYPNLTPEQRAEAEYYLTRYLEVIRGIFERTSKT